MNSITAPSNHHPALVYVPHHIIALRKQISTIEWENPDDPRLKNLKADLVDAQEALKRGEHYLPLF